MDRREQDTRYWRQFGQWMTERRKAMLPERWTQARLADEMTRAGFAVTRNWVNQVESGEKPSPEFVAAVERQLGTVPTLDTGPTPDQSSLIAALSRQTTAIEALVALLTPLVQSGATSLIERLDALEPVVSRLAEQALEAPQEQRLPQTVRR